jgi:signal transduction histidine kinase
METANIIQRNRNQIIENWLQKLKEEFPEVEKYEKSAIEDDVPNLIDTIINSLNIDNEEELKKIGTEHGKQRTNFKDYSLRQVIREYHLLKLTIFKEVDDHTRMSIGERNRILNVLDKAIEHSAAIYFTMEKEKVIRAKEQAEENVEQLKSEDVLRDDFISAVSHDLNNPINNIKMVVQLLESNEGSLDNGKLLKIIKQSTDKAEKLIRDLLDVNLIKSGAKLPLNISHCNLLDGIRQSVEHYQMKMGHERIKLNTEEQELLIKADCEAIIRAVDNLIDNAIKYGSKEETVTVECKKHDDNITITVLNYGNPISLKDQASIFTRFYRIKNSMNKGWGIGLSLVKGITEAHGGKVAVDSTATSGTRFTMIIPENYSE